MSASHTKIALQTLVTEISQHGERMKKLGDHLWSIRNQLNSETDFQAWLAQYCPGLNAQMIKDAMLYSLECRSEEQ